MTPRIELASHHPIDDGPGAWIQTPYDEDFIADLKEIVPWEARTWDGEERRWFIRDDYADQAVELVIHHFGETLIMGEDGSEEYRDANGPTARQERFL